MFIKGIGAVLLALSMTAGVADAATIFSDSFENPKNTRDWQVYQSFGSWVASSGSGIEIQTSGVAGINAHKGNQYVELDSDNSRGGVAGTTNSSMTTKLNLGAGTYRVDWYYRPRDNKADSNNIGVYLAGAGQDLFTRLLGKINKTKSSSNSWELVSYFFYVNGMKDFYALTFRAEGKADSYGGFIDDVSVSPVPVPVPAAGFLLIGALGGLAALRRRKTAA